MANKVLMEKVLHDLLPDLQAWHRFSRNRAFKKKLEKYVEQIHKALITPETNTAPQQ